jgi:imidazolonepropionase-like amidohydrolase
MHRKELKPQNILSKQFIVFVILIIVQVSFAFAQTSPIDGLRSNPPGVHALMNARIIIAPGQEIEKGIIVIRDGLIEFVGENITPPPDARIWDYSGKTIYPGFIESFSHLGLTAQKSSSDTTNSSNNAKSTGTGHWNPFVHPEGRSIYSYQPGDEDLKKLRSFGFTSALIVPEKGIFKGESSLLSLSSSDIKQNLIKSSVAQHLAFHRSGERHGSYPSSLMGCIALIRQTFYDVQWYRDAYAAFELNPKGQNKPEENIALKSIQPLMDGKQVIIFEVENNLNFLRALKITNEFALKPIIRGSGDEYLILDVLKQKPVPIILQINFPTELDVNTPEKALEVTLAEIQYWERAPANPKVLQDAGIRFSLTSNGLEKPEEFRKNIQKAITYGLSKEAALAALTVNPAQFFGIEDRLGTIQSGKLAHLIVTDGNVFETGTKILDVWVDGTRFENTIQPIQEVRGKWLFTLKFPDGSEWNGELEVKGEIDKLKSSISNEKLKLPVTESVLEFQRLKLLFQGDTLGYPGMILLSGRIEDKRITGQGLLPDGTSVSWTAIWKEPLPKESPEENQQKTQKQNITFISDPKTFGAYSRSKPPDQPKQILIKNATIWTCADEGKIEESDFLISGGKIDKIGKDLSASGDAMIIDGKGKHVTPGLIDCHSHSGISGSVNESTQSVSAEVRIEDVINWYSMDFYRELAGGLTVANLLHGSANPIGGQNAVVKLKWGDLPEQLIIDDAPPGIKFALGENVKQSNWGDEYTTRYPQTRMGVEQLIRDRFRAALDYEKEWNEYKAQKKKKGIIPPRRDLELDAILEALRGKRLVHCHAYRQDEILMLIRLAEEFGFTIASFQHILEGYKVADVLAKHGAGGSAFSDWWAYKFEVYDAIPYAGTLMHRAGMVASFNSDDDELARRLNTEAAKAVKYGELSEEKALKSVTINPAKQLKIDHRVGSLEPGKDADFVIWSGHPLSSYSICEQTWIEGRKYFDRVEDRNMRNKIEKQRQQLI